MPHFYNKLQEYILNAVQEIAGSAVFSHDRITVEPCRDAIHGEVATNAALILAKPTGKTPAALAAQLAETLKKMLPQLVSATPVAGFVNLRFQSSFWHDEVKNIIKQGIDYGRSNVFDGSLINLEYCSANPTGPLHIGHTRGAVFGDILSRLFTHLGAAVTREYYVNDFGSQVQILARSVYHRYQLLLGTDPGELPAAWYPGEYLLPVAEDLVAQYGNKWLNTPDTAWLPVFRRTSVAAMIDRIRADLTTLGVEFDVFTSEETLHENSAIEQSITSLKNLELIYEGTLPPPKGQVPEDWEDRPQLLFHSTQFGDDIDRPLKKADGSATYFAGDVAYHADKLRRGFARLVTILGADHIGYVKRLKAVVAALSGGRVPLDVLVCQLVNLYKDGQPYKMSKRAGTFITARDLVDEVGRDVVRFMLLTRKNDQIFDFDLNLVRQQTKDNPLFYVQYAHARCTSVLRHAHNLFGDKVHNFTATSLESLDDPLEIAMARLLSAWGRQLEMAGRHAEPHRIALYMIEIATTFHALWNKGRENTQLRFLFPEDFVKSAPRLVLVTAVKTVIAAGFNILNITPVEEM
ncbi:MAG: arginine--tRNA ligase [Holosporales bacterium]|jgi:arginyl-tRNA synthetase